MKALLRIFELLSGLHINISKSCLMGIHIEDYFLQAGHFFLHCNEGNITSNFLGIPIRSNYRTQSIWKPVVNNIKIKLAPRRAFFVYMGKNHSD